MYIDMYLYVYVTFLLALIFNMGAVRKIKCIQIIEKNKGGKGRRMQQGFWGGKNTHRHTFIVGSEVS